MQITPEECIDAALDSVLKASGSALRHYTMPLTLERMRDAMRQVMVVASIKGSNHNLEAMKKEHTASGKAADPACPWRPMSSAPKDGTAILALLEGCAFAHTIRWRDEGWAKAWGGYYLSGAAVPRYWVPVPDDPDDES